MSKPPIAAEPDTKTPTLKVEPTVSGPMLGGLVGQLVAVVEVVMQTTPVTTAWARGVCIVRKSEPARTITRTINRRLLTRL